ncbi:MAG TPA: hypothetical protein VN420_00800 [Candidatus Fimivivens sp.]|nr:hypothetical protein [Candidatus Fimivivens sp.]
MPKSALTLSKPLFVGRYISLTVIRNARTDRPDFAHMFLPGKHRRATTYYVDVPDTLSLEIGERWTGKITRIINGVRSTKSPLEPGLISSEPVRVEVGGLRRVKRQEKFSPTSDHRYVISRLVSGSRIISEDRIRVASETRICRVPVDDEEYYETYFGTKAENDLLVESRIRRFRFIEVREYRINGRIVGRYKVRDLKYSVLDRNQRALATLFGTLTPGQVGKIDRFYAGWKNMRWLAAEAAKTHVDFASHASVRRLATASA